MRALSLYAVVGYALIILLFAVVIVFLPDSPTAPTPVAPAAQPDPEIKPWPADSQQPDWWLQTRCT